jgi:Protein of unknown function (DUF4238)
LTVAARCFIGVDLSIHWMYIRWVTERRSQRPHTSQNARRVRPRFEVRRALRMIRSHIVPRLYLEQFTTKSTRSVKPGHLWVYQQNEPPRRGTSKSEGAENGYFAYPLPSGELDESLETILAKLEDGATHLLRRFSIGSFDGTVSNRKTMAEYVGLMFARSRGRLAANSWVHGQVSKLMNRLHEDNFLTEITAAASRRHNYPFTVEQISHIVADLAASNVSAVETKKGFLVNLRQNACHASESLLNLPWQIWAASSTSQFVTSDTPVTTAIYKGENLLPGFGFDIPGVLVFFPLTPRACLVMGHEVRDYQQSNPEVISSVNRLAMSFARKHVYARSFSLKINDDVQRNIAAVKFGENAFVVPGDFLQDLKRIIARKFGLIYPPSIGQDNSPPKDSG